MPYISKWPSQNYFERLESLRMELKLSKISDYIGEKEPSYEVLNNEMTNSDTPKKKNVFKTIRGLFKKKKEKFERKSVLGGDAVSDYGIVCYDELDMNPALDLVDNGLATSSRLLSVPAVVNVEPNRKDLYKNSPHYINLGNFKTMLTDFSTKMEDDAHSYVNLGYVGKNALAENMYSPYVAPGNETRQEATAANTAAQAGNAPTAQKPAPTPKKDSKKP